MLRFVVPIFCFSFISFAQTEFTLSPIVMEGAPIEALQLDPILPMREGTADQSSSSGSIEGSLSKELAVPITHVGQPGFTAQVRGLGGAAEDVGVQALGIPLNPAQGGGFNFSIYPQYLWSGFSFQNGPSLGSLEPRSTSGTLNLIPWTVAALMDPRARVRFTSFYSTADVGQLSLGYRTSEAAVVAGYSSGNLQGPAGGASTRFQIGRSRLKFHLLATDMKATPLGATAPLFTTRVTPVAQLDVPVGQSNLFKTSLFYDHISQKQVPTEDTISQIGVENALLIEDWKFGLSSRRISVDQTGFKPSPENQLNLQLARTFSVGTVLLDPQLQGTFITGVSAFPQASLGARREILQGLSLYSRVSYSRRVASLINRYYVLPADAFSPGFRGNPDLKPESDYTTILGVEGKGASWEASLEGYGQWRRDSQVAVYPAGTPGTVINQGSGRVHSLLGRVRLDLTSQLSVGDSLTLTDSYVETTGRAFPNQPSLIQIATIAYRTPDTWGIPEFEAEAMARTVSRTPTSSASELPGYSYLDVETRTSAIRGVTVAARIENLLGREIEVVQFAPKLGRTFSFLISGTF